MPERDDAAHGRRPISAIAAVGWTIGAVLLVQVLVAITESVRAGASRDFVNVVGCYLLAYSALVFAMVRRYAPTVPMRHALGVRGLHPGHVVVAVLAGAALYPPTRAFAEVVQKLVPLSAEEARQQAALFESPRVAVLFVALVVALPAIEELFFRGLLFGGLHAGRTPTATALMTALLFAASKADPRESITAVPIGLALGALRAQSGSSVSAWIAHAVFAGVPFLAVAASRDPDVDLAFPLSWTLGASAIALGALLTGHLLSARDARAKRARAEDAAA